MYRFLNDGIHGEVLDFPGAITSGRDLDDARRLLASALVDMAETHLLHGEPLPVPEPACTDADSDLEEPIHLLLTAASRVTVHSRKGRFMKRRDLLRHLERHSCRFIRKGGDHST